MHKILTQHGGDLKKGQIGKDARAIYPCGNGNIVPDLICGCHFEQQGNLVMGCFVSQLEILFMKLTKNHENVSINLGTKE